MTAERWAAVTSLVEQALALTPAERPSFLRAVSASPDLIAEAQELLAVEAEASQLFPIERWRTAPASAHNAGGSIDRYLLQEEIGRGGMGTVFRARRADGVYQQEVALKVLGDGLNTEALARRFQAERQILAGLTHTGIARLLDGGVTPQGQPFLVLEYVDGEPIDRFCETHALPLEARLRLFLGVAASVQFAHQQLVLHLDLKPANILVTPSGEPRLLDFGIARILEEAEGGWHALATVQLMTPRYASPEQIRGAKLGVASDVFSLATLLYRLLTGHFPYELEGHSALEAARIVCEQAARPPSSVAPAALAPALQGDLDCILLRALRKEPEHRYPTVAAFAADLERHLTQRPVEARTRSLRYTTGRFLRRHRAAALASAAVLLILMLSAVAVVRSAVVARQQRTEAERQRAAAVQRFTDLRALAHSYVFDLDKQLEPIPGTVKVRAFVLSNALKYLDSMSRETENDVDLAHEVGAGYIRIGKVQAEPSMPSLSDPKGAFDSLTRGVAVQRRVCEHDPNNLAERAILLRQLRVLEFLDAYNGNIERLSTSALEGWNLGQPILAQPPTSYTYLNLAEFAWDLSNANSGNGDLWNFADPVAALHWLDQMSDVLHRYASGRPAEAASHQLRSAAERQLSSRAWTLMQLNRPDEALALYREAIAISDSMPDEPLEVQSGKVARGNYAGALLATGHVREAEAVLTRIDKAALHEAGGDRTLTLDEADTAALLARADLQSGRIAQGVRRTNSSMATLEASLKADPEDASNASELAWDAFRIAEEPALPSPMRRRLYTRAAEVSARYAAAHPTVLSATLLIGSCELGQAVVAKSEQNLSEQRAHATRALAAFTRVLNAHPAQLQAAKLLEAAKRLAA